MSPSGTIAFVRLDAFDGKNDLFVDTAGTSTLVYSYGWVDHNDLKDVRADGSNVVFNIFGPSMTMHWQPANLFTVEGGTVALSDIGSAPRESSWGYALEGGWIAYMKMLNGMAAAWTRTPTGATAIASPWPRAFPIAVNASGEVVCEATDPISMLSGRFLGAAGASSPTKPIFAGFSQGPMRSV